MASSRPRVSVRNWGKSGRATAFLPITNSFPIGAVPQDRQGSPEFPAAHLAPCTLEVGHPSSAGGTRPEIYRTFSDAITRTYTEDLFRKTDLVHRLTNYADVLHEGTRGSGKTGVSHILVQSCNLTVKDPH